LLVVKSSGATTADSLAPTEEAGEHGAVDGLLALTRVLVGVATQGLEQLGGDVSLPQFRLLMALAQHGPTPSARVAERLGSVASTVTRLADHLEDRGYVRRRRERPNRSVVALELTESGQELVERVVDWRRTELARIVERLPARRRREVAAAAAAFVEAAGPGHGARPGPLPL